METTYPENRAGLKLKFAIFYILSVGLILFIASLLVPHNASPGNFSAAKPIGDADLQATNLMSALEILNIKYKNLKELDQEFAQETTSAADALAANQTLQAAESSINNSLDSIGRVARSLTDRKATLQLQNFTDAYRLALSDRSAMRVYKIAALTSGKSTANKDVVTQMQNEISARDKRIAELQNQNYSLEQRTKTVAANGSTNANQQAMDALKATISDQEKKIASLSTINTALEKQNVANSKDLDAAKKSTDNSASALKSQNALLEKRVADLTTEVRLAQVDCSLTRADASQIISSSKQRKNLLSDALGTLNSLSATSDPTIKKKIADKIVRLNQVASTVHD